MVHYCEICPNNEKHRDRGGRTYITCMFYSELLELMEVQGIDLRTVDCATGGIFELPYDSYNITQED